MGRAAALHHVRICSGLTNTEGAFINSAGNAHLYLAGPVSFIGTGLNYGQSEIYFHGNVHFTGGITNETGGPVCFRMNSANEWIEGKGIHLSNTFAIDYGGALNISAPANDWTTLASYKATIICHNTNVLAKGKPVRMGGTGVYLSDTSKLNLNGYDQSIGQFYMGWTRSIPTTTRPSTARRRPCWRSRRTRRTTTSCRSR